MHDALEAPQWVVGAKAILDHVAADVLLRRRFDFGVVDPAGRGSFSEGYSDGGYERFSCRLARWAEMMRRTLPRSV